jgi:autotransporter-associated beta strand protein
LISYNTGPIVDFCGSGINLVLTTNQTNSVQIVSPVAQSSILRVFGITIDGPSGQLIVGGGNPANEFITVSRPSGATHDWINNSTNPAVIAPNVAFQAGGGAVYMIGFDGSGDWRVTNSLANANNTGILLTKLGPGTWYWNGPTTPGLPLQPNGTINSPLALSGGTVVLQWANPRINNVAVQNNGTLLEYDAPSQAQTLNGVISGTGLLQVNNGTLTLAGQNTYSGNTVLIGGVLVVNSAENPGVSGPLGVGGTIAFAGGTLGFSVNNTFDYSSRFSTAASQAYSIDTRGQNVTFTTGLTSSGGTLTKLGAGTLTLTGTSTYSGKTTVSGGKLVFQGPKPGTDNITVADGAALGVTATGPQVTPSTLTVGASSGCTLEFNNVNSTTTAPLAPATVSSVGTVTININSGTFTVGQSYPLLAWSSGSAPTVSLGVLNGYLGNLSFTGNTLELNITAIVTPPTLNFTQTGNSLQFSWTGSFKLQSQTNNLNVGLNTNWADYPGGASPVTVPIDAMQDTVFFRLVSTP